LGNLYVKCIRPGAGQYPFTSEKNKNGIYLLSNNRSNKASKFDLSERVCFFDTQA